MLSFFVGCPGSVLAVSEVSRGAGAEAISQGGHPGAPGPCPYKDGWWCEGDGVVDCVVCEEI